MNNFFHFEHGGTNRGKTQAANDWANAHSRNDKSSTFKTPLIMVPVPGLTQLEIKKGTFGIWTAPAGWNNYLRTGNFIGCMPIIKPGAKINARAFETIKFEMA
jgi:hypothetical protein